MEDKTDSSLANQPGLLSASVMDADLFRSLVLHSAPRLRVIDCAGRAVAPERAGKGVYFLIAGKPKRVVVR
jgi:hypothetical protein